MEAPCSAESYLEAKAELQPGIVAGKEDDVDWQEVRVVSVSIVAGSAALLAGAAVVEIDSCSEGSVATAHPSPPMPSWRVRSSGS